jgi:hypothetical protein
MSTMGSLVSSNAKNNSTMDWPMETFPGYESIASDFRVVSGATMILTAPLVELAEKQEWEAYAVANQGWIQDSMTKSGIVDAHPAEISGVIYEYQAGQVAPSKVGPFAPVWQLSAFANGEDTSMINFNLMSNHVFENTYNLAVFAQQAMLSKVFDEGESLLLSSKEESFQPESIVVQPLYDAPEAKDRRVVGALVGVIPWNIFFSRLLHEGVEGMVCVLSNTCGQAYTFEVNGGEAVYVGLGDRHDTTYDRFVHVVGVYSVFDSADTCAFTIHVYPSKDLEEYYKTFRPALFATLMVLVFLFSAVLFGAYDKAVASRQKDAISAAARTDAIVSVRFPLLVLVLVLACIHFH